MKKWVYLTLATMVALTFATQAAAWTTYVSYSDPGTTRPGSGAPWGLSGSPGFNTLPPNVGDMIWFGITNAHIATNTKSFTFTLTSPDASKFSPASLTGYVNTTPPTATPGGITGITDGPGTRTITGTLVPQPSWEVIKLVRTAAFAPGFNKANASTFTQAEGSSHCSRTQASTNTVSFFDASFGVLDGPPILINEVLIFADSQAAGPNDDQLFSPPDYTGPWVGEIVFAGPDGEPRPQGGVRWFTEGEGLGAQEIYGQTFSMLGDADTGYSLYGFDQVSGQYYYFRIEVAPNGCTPAGGVCESDADCCSGRCKVNGICR